MCDDRRTSTPVAGPQRTCIASRRTQSADRLLRCVAVWDSAGAVSVLVREYIVAANEKETDY